MCGIAGVLITKPTDGMGSSAIALADLQKMGNSIRHRGPDGDGYYITKDKRCGMVHRRLSIIDLSNNANQPMTNEDDSLWIVFNGEIYNHLALRRELSQAGHRFRTDHSDTEVLLHGYEQWGLQGLLGRLYGDFVFALYDEKTGKFMAARDRIGVKPLYFSHYQGVFLFGSEIKAILAHPSSPPRSVEPMAMYHYLTFLTTPAPLTMFSQIYKLPAAHWLEIDRHGKISQGRYWDAVPGQSTAPQEVKNLSEAATEDYYVTTIRQRLEQSVERRMMSDVPFGVFLSGGIDSSTNVAMMSRLMDRPVDSFTVGFKDYHHLNELEHANRIAQDYRTNHHEILIDEKDMIGYLGQLIHHQDEPIADWVCIPLYFVSKLTRDSGVTVIQVGEGSDEQFCGYASYMGYLELYHRYWRPFQNYLPQPLQRMIASVAGGLANFRPRYQLYADIIDRAARKREHFWSGATVFWDSLKRPLVHEDGPWQASFNPEFVANGLIPSGYAKADSYEIIRSFLEPFDKNYPHQDALTRMIHNEFRLRLPELLLMRVDKITMSESLEARVPFLDHDLVEFSMDIPEKWKTKNGVAKYLLKKAVEGLIPDEIIYRRKMGFGAPMAEWLKGKFGEAVQASVLASPLLNQGYFQRDHVRHLFEIHRANRQDTSLYLWTLFNLTSWYDYWIEGKAPLSL